MQGAHWRHALGEEACPAALGYVTCRVGLGVGACLGDLVGCLLPVDILAGNHLKGPETFQGDRRACREAEEPCPYLVDLAACRTHPACPGEVAFHPACRLEGEGPCQRHRGEEKVRA